MSKERVYWSPIYDPDATNWSILYQSPERVISKHEILRKNNSTRDFYSCPVVNKTMQNIYSINNPIYTKIVLNDVGEIDSSKSRIGIDCWISEDRTLENSPFLFYNFPIIFFSESEIEMMLTSPFFGKSSHASNASIIPGKFNIGSWFRTINFEFNLWSDTFEIKEDESIAFINFLTSKTVELKRFSLTKNLFNLANINSASSKWLPNYPLEKRYSLFRKSNVKEIILKEIKENLIE